MRARISLFTLCGALLAASPGWSAAIPAVNEIVARSVANNDADWKAAPQFAFKEHDVITKGGERTSRTYEVLMIEGSPYQKLVAVNGRPLDSTESAAEERKLRRETGRRQRETPAVRSKRIAAYARERRQDHELMREMIKAFRFKLTGTETLNGRQCFRVEATPRPGYIPQSRETKVLTGMRGNLWIDTAAYQWVKVVAGVFRPVAFGLFIAHVQPGTEFTLEEAPADGNVWLPSHFRMKVNAKILFFAHASDDDETYWDYRRITQTP